MKSKVWLIVAALLVVGAGAAVLLSPLAGAAPEPEQVYDLDWWTVDGGGGSSSAAGHYALDGTAGQPDPGPQLLGTGYQLEGGFWNGGLSGVSWYDLYLPVILRGYQ
jgi:hypothetical protein